MDYVFPEYHKHEDARCYNCDGPLENHIRDTYPRKRGEYCGQCYRCGITTWYDLIEPKEQQ